MVGGFDLYWGLGRGCNGAAGPHMWDCGAAISKMWYVELSQCNQVRTACHTKAVRFTEVRAMDCRRCEGPVLDVPSCLQMVAVACRIDPAGRFGGCDVVLEAQGRRC